MAPEGRASPQHEGMPQLAWPWKGTLGLNHEGVPSGRTALKGGNSASNHGGVPQDAWRTPSKADGAGGEELAAAQEELDDAEQGGRVTARTPWQSVVEARPQP